MRGLPETSDSASSKTLGTRSAPTGGGGAGPTLSTLLRRPFLPLLGLGAVILVWYVAWSVGVANRELLPRPDQVASELWQQLISGSLYLDIGVSLGRVLIGMAIGCSLAVPAGIVLAWYPALRRMFEPIINFFRAVPPIALIPLFIVYLGIGELARVSVLVYASFFTSVVVIYEGVTAIEAIYIRAARVLGASEAEIFRKVVIPLVIPQIFVALRISVGLCWGTLVAAELLAASNGLGAVIQNAGNFFQIPVIYVGILCIGALALLMDLAVRMAMKRAVRWQERVER